MYSHALHRLLLDNKPHSKLGPHVHSVFLAEGLHLSMNSATSDLPNRFEAGSTKARLTWFGALCLAGIGMFVEAYIIITTGQIKTIWHSAMPTCFSVGMKQYVQRISIAAKSSRIHPPHVERVNSAMPMERIEMNSFVTIPLRVVYRMRSSQVSCLV